MSSLSKANLLVLGLLIVHTLDHGLHQASRTQPGSAALVGAASFALLAASCLVALQRSPAAPVFSAFAGGLTAFGLVVVHLLPNWWGWVSDPYWDIGANLLSWLSLILLLAAATYLCALGLRYRRNRHMTPIYRE